jgi:hypothetical protein
VAGKARTGSSLHASFRPTRVGSGKVETTNSLVLDARFWGVTHSKRRCSSSRRVAEVSAPP